MVSCGCTREHETRLIVITGGPGAGKTAFLELVRQSFCRHVQVLPEAAGIVFGGGFPREAEDEPRRAAQRAIFHVQRELEAVGRSHRPALLLCDRGTLDGLAYWPGPADEFFSSVRADRAAEIARYHAVIHLRTPSAALGYNHVNPLRTESALQAAEIDQRIADVWAGHPRRWLIESSPDFLDKASRAFEALHGELPECCAHQHLGRTA